MKPTASTFTTNLGNTAEKMMGFFGTFCCGVQGEFGNSNSAVFSPRFYFIFNDYTKYQLLYSDN